MKKVIERWLVSLICLGCSFLLFKIPINIKNSPPRKVEFDLSSAKTFADFQSVKASVDEHIFSVNFANPFLLLVAVLSISILLVIFNPVKNQKINQKNKFNKKTVTWHLTTIINAFSITMIVSFGLLFIGNFLPFGEEGLPDWGRAFVFIVAELFALLIIVLGTKKRNLTLRGLGFWGRDIWGKCLGSVGFLVRALPIWFFLIVISSPVVNEIRGYFGIEKPIDRQVALIVELSFRPFFLVLLAVLTFTIVPLVEEFLFRGLIYGTLRKYFSAFTAAIICGIVFSLAHQSLDKFIPIAFLGYLLCRIREDTESIYPAIAVHSFYNAFILIMMVSMFC